MSIAEYLALIRKNAGYASQQTFADEIFMSHDYVYKREKGIVFPRYIEVAEWCEKCLAPIEKVKENCPQDYERLLISNIKEQLSKNIKLIKEINEKDIDAEQLEQLEYLNDVVIKTMGYLEEKRNYEK